jgi:protein arginine N-methyltransferase 1
MSSPTVYSVSSYGEMILNEPRMAAFDAALRKAVTPGCTVIDIGAGTGIFSLLACKYGTAHVVAIEPADSVLILQEMARANGFEDRITILQDLSTHYKPERKADVIISDLRGTLPLFEHHIATIVDARERLLRPGGTLIPISDTICGALVQADDYQKFVEQPWKTNSFGLDLSAGHRFAANNIQKAYLTPKVLVSEVQDIATLDYISITDPNLKVKTVFRPNAEGTPNGVLIWFDMTTASGIRFSNAPGQPELVYGQTFLPFETPYTIGPDDRIEVTLKATLIDGRYEWSWFSDIFIGIDEKPIVRMRQSGFKSQVMSPARLAGKSNSHVPMRSSKHDIDVFILEQVDGKKPLQEIADNVILHFGDQIETPKKALDMVASLTGRYE